MLHERMIARCVLRDGKITYHEHAFYRRPSTVVFLTRTEDHSRIALP